MNFATKVFLGLLAALLLNVAFSLSLTFTVPPDVSPFDSFLQSPAQLSMFIATGLIVMLLDFYLLFGNIGQVEFVPPYTPSAVFGFMSPFLFLSLYFVRRPTTPGVSITFFDLIPMTFITIMFYTILTIINSITDNVRVMEGVNKRRRP